MARAGTDAPSRHARAVLLEGRDRTVPARRLYEEAAAAGYPAAMNNLGKLLAR